jgi:UDP-glucose 4-epimerase
VSLRTVVVGGSGFLGGATVRELLRRGDSVTVADRAASRAAIHRQFGAGVGAFACDILDRASVRRAFRGADEVYHFAGRLGTSELEDDVVGAIDANITGAVNVFEAAIAAGVSVVFFPSKPNVWLNAYTITKVAAEQFAKLFAERDGMSICSLRYFNAYGPGQALGPVRKIIPTFAMQGLHGRPLTVYGDGEQTVDMIHSADIARLTVDVVRSGYAAEPIDCGRGVPLTVNDVAAAVNEHFGNLAGIEHLPMRVGEIPGTKLVADVGPLSTLLGSLSFADWRSSLAETLSWYAKVHGAAPQPVPTTTAYAR